MRLRTCVRRFEDHVLEVPDYFPMWVHWLKTLESYKNCANANSKCRGEMDNRMDPFPERKCKKDNHMTNIWEWETWVKTWSRFLKTNAKKIIT